VHLTFFESFTGLLQTSLPYSEPFQQDESDTVGLRKGQGPLPHSLPLLGSAVENTSGKRVRSHSEAMHF